LFGIAAIGLFVLSGLSSLGIILREYAQLKKEGADRFSQVAASAMMLSVIFFVTNVAMPMFISADELARDAVQITLLTHLLFVAAASLAVAVYLSAYVLIISLIREDDRIRWPKIFLVGIAWAISAVILRIDYHHIDDAATVMTVAFVALSVVGVICQLTAKRIQALEKAIIERLSK